MPLDALWKAGSVTTASAHVADSDDVLVATGNVESIDAMIDRLGLRQMNDSSALESIVDEVLAKNEKNIAEYRAGKDKAFNALVGQVMKASQGKANPAQVNALLKAKLG
jgi:aspartyl-tRNA(Asn)/glutamyl-tRNA(Gln) amidotransferase subunit B